MTEDGKECSFRGTYSEVEPPTRTVATWLFEGWPDAWADETVELRETDGVTTLTMTTGVPRPGRPRPHDQARRPGRQLRQVGGLPEVATRSEGNGFWVVAARARLPTPPAITAIDAVRRPSLTSSAHGIRACRGSGTFLTLAHVSVISSADSSWSAGVVHVAELR